MAPRVMGTCLATGEAAGTAAALAAARGLNDIHQLPVADLETRFRPRGNTLIRASVHFVPAKPPAASLPPGQRAPMQSGHPAPSANPTPL